jgi:23S rRNA (uracil1939-C5)-methyltransferase
VSEEIVAVSGIAAGGDGVGRMADGRAVFLPRTAPGERVRVRGENLRVHRRYARGEAVEILEPASVRVEPPCPHYTRDHCGGCRLQHLAYPAQLDAKRAIVGETLRRIGKLDVPDPDIEPAGSPWRYRTTLTLAVGERPGWGRTLGLHPFDHPGAVFPLEDCHIADPRLMTLWRELQSHTGLLPDRLTRLVLRLDRTGGRHVIAESAGVPWRTADQLRQQLTDSGTVACWWQPVDGAARVLAGPVTGFPATAFEQANPPMADVARRWAIEQLGDVRDALVWDLYGGSGDAALVLARRGARVVSVDADEQAVAWARQRPEIAALGEAIRCVAGRAEDVLPSLPPPAAVIVHPPRTGLHWDVVARLETSPVAQLVYVSSDPATLARDLHRLSVNYQVRAVRAFDLFPQTAQVETVVHLAGAV